MLQAAFISFLTFLILLIIWILGKMVLLKSVQPEPQEFPASITGVQNGFEKRLSRAIRFHTISDENGLINATEFENLIRFLKQNYPKVFETGRVKNFGTYSKLVVVEGNNKDLNPILLTAHIDVVPVDEKDLKVWDYPPFSGQIDEGYIYGRGSLDDKCSALGILEALESLLHTGYLPNRSLYIAIGEDEEINGLRGAHEMATWLRSEKITFETILDEGGLLADGIVPGIKDKPVALVGTSEKGYLSLEISCEIPGGHSSMPERTSAIGKVNSAIHQLLVNPFPKRISGPVKGFMRYLGPHLPFLHKMAFANPTIFKRAILNIYNKTASSRALIQTTISPTVFNAGIKSNMIPAHASAMVNFRILPGESIQSVISKVKAIVKDLQVKIEPKGYTNDPTAVSSENASTFKLLGQSILQVFDNALIAPYLTLATTDVRHYEGLSENIYRFLPITMTTEDLARIHGVNERISIISYRKAILFYQVFIVNFCK